MELENTDIATNYDYYLIGCTKLGWSNPLSPLEFRAKYTLYQRCLPVVEQASEEVRRLQGDGFMDALQALFDSPRFHAQQRICQQWHQVSFIGSAVAAGKNNDDGTAEAGIGASLLPPPPSRSGTASQAIPELELS